MAQSNINPKNIEWDEPNIDTKNIVWDGEQTKVKVPPGTPTISAQKDPGVLGELKNFIGDPGLYMKNRAKDIAGGVGSFIESGANSIWGGIVPKATSELTNAFESGVNKERAKYGEKPIPKMTVEESKQLTHQALKQNTGASSDVIDNPVIKGAGSFAGQVAGDMILMQLGGALFANPATKIIATKIPGLQTALKAVSTGKATAAQKLLVSTVTNNLLAPVFTTAKKGIEEGKLPEMKDYLMNQAFFGLSPIGESAVEAGANQVLKSQAPQAVKNAVKAASIPAEGAAGGVTGIAATYPVMDDEEKKNFNKDMWSTAGAQALLHTASKLGELKFPEAKPAEVKPVEKRTDTEIRKVIDEAPEAQKPQIIQIARNMEQWKAQADKEGRSWVDVMKEQMNPVLAKAPKVEQPKAAQPKVEQQKPQAEQPISYSEWEKKQDPALLKRIENDYLADGRSTEGKQLQQKYRKLVDEHSPEVFPKTESSKNPWEMSKEELLREKERLTNQEKEDYWKFTRQAKGKPVNTTRLTEVRAALGETMYPWQRTYEEFNSRYPITKEAYKRNVENALSEGKPVSQEVLKQFPDLKSKPSPKDSKVISLENYVKNVGFNDIGEAHLAFEAKKNGIAWFKKEFPDIKDPQTAYNELTGRIGSLSKEDEGKLNLNLQFFAKSKPEALNEARERLIKQYGTIPTGEAPRVNDVKVPAATDEGKTRRFARTAAEATPKESSNVILEGVDKGEFAYTPISNKETISKAESELGSSGFDAAYQKWRGTVDSQKKFTADDIALGEALLTKAAKEGNTEAAKRITIDLAAELTNAGQTVQAARLLKRMSPEGYSVYVQKQVDRVNRELKSKFGDKAPKIELTDAERQAILNAPTTEARDEIGMQIASRVAQEMPVTLMEKFNAWRRMAMLFNPKTHIRNIGGNALFIPLRKVADTIGAGLEKTLPVGERTKSIGWSKDEKLVKLVDESWEANKDKLVKGGRWEIGKTLGKEKRVFKTKPLEAVNKLSAQTLEAEDIWFLRRAYRDALGQYLKANKTTKITDAAVNYAVRRAEEATYRDASKLANWLNQLKRQGGAAGMVTEALIPFAKTPINVAKRGIEYSPVGLLKGLTYSLGKVKKGEKTASEAIEEMAKGLTGTGAMILGIWLKKNGVITGAADEDRDKAAFDKVAGKQPFAINIDGKYYTWDWAQPVSTPIAMGAQIYDSIKGNDNLVNSIFNGISTGADTVFNIPLFQNVRKVVGGRQSVASALGDIFESYFKQAVPVVGGQIARTVDPTIRSTYTPKGGKDLLSNLGYRGERTVKYIESRTPGLSSKLSAQIDTWGNEVKQPDNVAARAALNFVSPGFYSESNDSEVNKELDRLYKSTGKNTIFPKVAPKQITYDKQKYELTPEQYNQMQRYLGQGTLKRYQELINNKYYKNAKDEQKVKMMESALSSVSLQAKLKLLKDMKIIK